jgi:FHA domain
VNVADKRCDNGHFIDESWDICPYCPNDAAEPEIPVVRPRSMEVAVAAPSPSPAAAAAVREPSIRPVTASRPAPVPAPALQVVAAGPSSQPERTVAASRGDLKRYVVGWLVGINGSTRGESYPVRMGRNVIGRDKRSDIVVNDDQASSHHADLVFRPEERRFILMDHNSTNGTYVNEAEIEPRRDLAGKDVVRIGSHRFLFMPLCHDGFHWDDEGPLK